jgi:hypothetical protein
VTTAYSSEILADFDKYDGKEVILAGRLMGKASWERLRLRKKTTDSNLCCER